MIRTPTAIRGSESPQRNPPSGTLHIHRALSFTARPPGHERRFRLAGGAGVVAHTATRPAGWTASSAASPSAASSRVAARVSRGAVLSTVLYGGRCGVSTGSSSRLSAGPRAPAPVVTSGRSYLLISFYLRSPLTFREESAGHRVLVTVGPSGTRGGHIPRAGLQSAPQYSQRARSVRECRVLPQRVLPQSERRQGTRADAQRPASSSGRQCRHRPTSHQSPLPRKLSREQQVIGRRVRPTVGAAATDSHELAHATPPRLTRTLLEQR